MACRLTNGNHKTRESYMIPDYPDDIKERIKKKGGVCEKRICRCGAVRFDHKVLRDDRKMVTSKRGEWSK